MLLESTGFIFFSLIEGLGLFVLMLSIYRLKVTDHLWPALVMILIMSIQSLVMRFEFELAYIVPVINIVLFTFLLAAVWKVSIVWSVIVSITGYLAFGLIQTLMVVSIFGSAEVVKSSDVNGYILQLITGFITTLLGCLLYKLGFGFTFDFERLRLKFEHFIVVGSIIVFFIIFALVMYENELWINFIFTTCGIALLLYYAVRKEREYYD